MTNRGWKAAPTDLAEGMGKTGIFFYSMPYANLLKPETLRFGAWDLDFGILQIWFFSRWRDGVG
ncbi:MAG: hypothetical protein WBH36_11700 [Syntrophobacteria bacterium]